MQEEIEVEEYVRTCNGIIGKICDEDGIDKNGVYTDTEYINEYCDKTVYIPNKDIVKHSKNIIDLIEVGDYVNGREVKHIAMFEGFPDYPKLIFVDEKHLIPDDTAENKDIKSIVTHEQFKSIEYKI